MKVFNSIPSPIPLPSWCLEFPLGAPSTSLAIRSAVLCQDRWSRTILAKVFSIIMDYSIMLGTETKYGLSFHRNFCMSSWNTLHNPAKTYQS